MIDRRGLEHRLALARQAFSPAADAKARVLEGLSAAPIPNPVRVGAFTAPRVAALMGLSLALGFVLGLNAAMPDTARGEPPERAGGLQEPSSPAEPSLSAPPPTTATPLAPAHLSSPVATTGEPTSEAASSALAAPAPSSLNSAPHSVRPAARTRRAARSEAISPSAAPPVDAPRDAASRARDELALLQRVERALRAKQAALALALLDELDRRHPRSTLLEERTAARVVAGCLLPMASARRPGERTAADRFLSEQHASVYADRVRRACGL